MQPPANTLAVGALWYKTILQSASCSNVAKPQGFDTGTDSLDWAVIIAPGSSGMQVRTISNGVTLQTAAVSPGLNWGSPTGVKAGVQTLEVLDASGKVVMSATQGKCVSAGCPDGVYNMNYQVLGLASGAGNGGSCS
jgi:glucan endo-1,3-alpha-glucosidase